MRWATLLIIIVLLALGLLPLGQAIAVKPSGPGFVPIGVGSIPGRLFPNGTVCIVDAKDSLRCKKILFKASTEIMKMEFFSFYGIFDLDNDGAPEVFFDYWPGEEYVNLLVYKKFGKNYRTYLKLQAESAGYAPGAWFLSESPTRKAIFRTRYSGSSGEGLFYLDIKKRSLDLITNGILLIDDPIFEDVNKDGTAEIFLIGRGYDRTSDQGAGLLHWKDGTYKLWWPSWTSPPYVMYAKLVNLDHDQQKEIIAVLESEVKSFSRELAVWKLTKGAFTLTSKVKLPDASDGEDPEISTILLTSHGAEISLDYSEKTLKCIYLSSKITCSKTENR